MPVNGFATGIDCYQCTSPICSKHSQLYNTSDLRIMSRKVPPLTLAQDLNCCLSYCSVAISPVAAGEYEVSTKDVGFALR